MPAPTPPSQHLLRRIVQRLPRLIAMLDELDLPDRRTPLARGFSGPRLRLVNDMRRVLGETPFQLARRPPPGALFAVLLVTLKEANAVARRAFSTVDRRTYPRHRGGD